MDGRKLLQKEKRAHTLLQNVLQNILRVKQKIKFPLFINKNAFFSLFSLPLYFPLFSFYSYMLIPLLPSSSLVWSWTSNEKGAAEHLDYFPCYFQDHFRFYFLSFILRFFSSSLMYVSAFVDWQQFNTLSHVRIVHLFCPNMN
jgi:hypothetical protein